MGYQVFAHDVAQRVLQLHGLYEEIVLGIDAGGRVRSLEVEAEPLLNAKSAKTGRASGQIEEEAEVERERSGEDGVAAKKVDLELHGVSQPAEDIDVVPAFLVVAAGRVVVDANLVVQVLVEVRVEFRLQNDVEHAELGFFLGFEGLRVVEDLAVTVAKDVGGVPAGDAEHTSLEGRGQDRLDERLAGLEVLAADGCVHLARELSQSGDINGKIGSSVGEGDAFLERGPGVEHGRRDAGIVVDQTFFKGFQRLMGRALLEEDLSRAAPDHHLAIGSGLEGSDVVADLVGEITLVLASLDLGPVEAFDIVLIEDTRHGLNGLEKGANLFKLIAVENLRMLRGVVEVAAEDIPAGEDKIIKLRDGREVLDEWGAIVGAFAEANGAHLRGGADGFGKAATDGFNAGDEGGGDGSHAGNHDAELAGCGEDAGRRRVGGFGC